MLRKVLFPFLTFVLIVCAVFFGIALSLLVNRLPDSHQSVVEKELWIFKGNSISQTITPKNNGLNVVTMYLRNVILRNKDLLIFTLSDESGREIRRINLNGYNVGDGDNVRFQFDPIPDSSGRNFTITLSAPDTVSDQNAVGVGYTSATDTYPGGQASSPVVDSGDLAFQLFYSPTSKSLVIKTAISDFLSRIFHPSLLIMFVGSGLTTYVLTSSLFKLHVK